ncbi:MAG: hypothetical protein AAGB93_05930 [Planctomycetota bacterium]
MRWTTAAGLFLPLAAGGALVTYVLTREPPAPGQVLAEVRSEIETPPFDEADAIRRLDGLLDDARETSDAALGVEVLLTRSDVYRQLAAYDRARADLETLLSTHRRGDRALELELARLEALDGEVKGALQRTRSLLQREPEFAEAWAVRGQLEVQAAREALDALFARVDLALSRLEAVEAKERLLELAARAPDDPALANLRFELGDLFAASAEAELYDVLALVSEPRDAFQRARQAYATAISMQPSAQSVVALAELLTISGQPESAILLELAAQGIPSIGSDPDGLTSLLGHLANADRVDEAEAFLKDWDWRKGGSREFFQSSAEIFYRAGNFAPLTPIATGLRQLGGETGAYWAQFYRSLRAIRSARTAKDPTRLQNSLRRSVDGLKAFIRDESYGEPFFGAKTDATFWLAEAHRHMGNVAQEREALRKALRLRPDDSAEPWVRYAETLKQQSPVPWGEVELALTRALDLAPERTTELVDAWLEAGRNGLQKDGLTVEGLVGEAARQQSPVPSLRRVGPAAMTLIARAHLEAGRGISALRAASAALDEYSNLVPPRDVMIGAKLLEPSRYPVERDLVARIEVAGIDATVEGYLAQLPAGRLQGPELVRAIRAAPVRFGKPAVARWFQERGETRKAAEALVGLDAASSPASLRLLYARTLLDEEKWKEAIEQLDLLAGDERAAPEALLLKATALVGWGRLRQLDEVVVELQSLNGPPQTRLLTADLLMACGRSDLAVLLVDGLDASARTRTPDFYRRRVLVDILLAAKRGPATASESIARSEAYLRDGTPELAAIVYAVAQREWTDLPLLVERLRRSDYRPTPQEEVALLYMEERIEAGRRTADERLAASPRDPSWAFLACAGAALFDGRADLPRWFGPRASADAALLFRGSDTRNAKDPRDALIVFLLSRKAEWAPWLLPRNKVLSRDTGSTIWSSWLSLRIHEARGDGKTVEEIVSSLTESHREFGPAHDIAVRIAEEAFPSQPLSREIVRARRMRLESLGPDLIDDPVEIALAEAGELHRRKRYGEAAQTIRTVLEAGGEAAMEGRVILGTLMIRLRQPSFAAQYLFEAAMGEPGVYEELVLDSLLYSFRMALEAQETGTPQRGALTRARALEMLDAIARRYPNDPVVALVQLEMEDIEDGVRGARARGILDRLHGPSGQRTLEQLRPGSTRRWVEMLVGVAPEVAYDLVQRDLAIEPGNLNLWLLSGVVAEARGEGEEARIEYETLLAIDPAAEIGYLLAELLISQGEEGGDLESILSSADRAQGGGSLRSNYLRALGEMRGRKPNLGRVANRLGNLWKARKRAEREVDPLQLGLLYAEALLRRDTVQSLNAMGTLLRELTPVADEDLYAGDLVVALDGVRVELLAQAKAAEAEKAAAAKKAPQAQKAPKPQ